MSERSTTPSAKSGLSPGSLIHVGERLESEVRISVLEYERDAIEAYDTLSMGELIERKRPDTVTWVTVTGLHDVGPIEAMGQHFGIHPLVLEDILNTHQRPKFEEFDDYLFIVLKSLRFDQQAETVAYEQISLLLLEGFVFTFKEKSDETFEPIRLRLMNGHSHFRSHAGDYLAYALLDTIVDQYFVFQDSLDQALDALEDEVLESPTPDTLARIQRLKREMVLVKRGIAPLRELLSTLVRSETSLIRESTKVYLRDVYDHALRVAESFESYRDLLSGFLDVYLSNISNKMNEVMKVLTVFAAIFIPLTFIAGIYGMNFEHMPELKWVWAYPLLWVGFLTIAGGLLLYFKRKKWL